MLQDETVIRIQSELLEPQNQPLIPAHKQPRLSAIDHCYAIDLSEETEYKIGKYYNYKSQN